MTPWSGNAAATPISAFSLQATPGGGACAATLAARPFAPSFAAAPKSNAAGAYSPLHVQLTRTDGQQELKAVTVTLAPGMIGKLAGIPYCPDERDRRRGHDQRRRPGGELELSGEKRSRDRHGPGGHRRDAAADRRQGLPLGSI